VFHPVTIIVITVISYVAPKYSRYIIKKTTDEPAINF